MFLILTSFFLWAQPTNLWAPKNPELKKSFEKITHSNIVSLEALTEAFQFYEEQQKAKKLRQDYMAILDFKLSSKKKRLSLVDIKNGTVEQFKVSHGKGSDKNHDSILDGVSSLPGSYATPPGFHRAKETYTGKHGLSLKMDGLESRNSTSRQRLIVIHGAKYVSWKHTGRSLGCPAVENRYIRSLIEKLKGGGLIYHYY